LEYIHWNIQYCFHYHISRFHQKFHLHIWSNIQNLTLCFQYKRNLELFSSWNYSLVCFRCHNFQIKLRFHCHIPNNRGKGNKDYVCMYNQRQYSNLHTLCCFYYHIINLTP
jgi:hypothetical protein